MNARDFFAKTMEWSGTICVVLLALPLFVVAAFVLRAAFVAAAIIGLAGLAVLTCVSPGFRRWIDHVSRPPGTGVKA